MNIFGTVYKPKMIHVQSCFLVQFLIDRHHNYGIVPSMPYHYIAPLIR